MTEKAAKDRPGYSINLDEIVFISEHAIFPIELLRRMAEVSQMRTIEHVDHGVNRQTHPYPLRGICYCYYCDLLAERDENPKLRTHLGRIGYPGRRAYRHHQGASCGCFNRSVPADVIGGEVGRLLQLFTVRDDAVKALADSPINQTLPSQRKTSTYDQDTDHG